MDKLTPGDAFPTIKGKTVHEEAFTLPDELSGRRFILLFYRGKW